MVVFPFSSFFTSKNCLCNFEVTEKSLMVMCHSVHFVLFRPQLQLKQVTVTMKVNFHCVYEVVNE